MSSLAQLAKSAPGRCEIEINGMPLAGAQGLVSEVTVRMKRGFSTTASVSFGAYRDEQGQWFPQDTGVVEPWDRVIIRAHFGPGDEGEELIRGYAREIAIEYPQDMGAARMTVEVQDDLLRLDREHVQGILTREGQERSDGELVRELVESRLEQGRSRGGDDGKLDVDAADGLTATTLSIDSSLAKFIRERAEANGFELYVRKGTLYFGPKQLDASSQPAILVYAGDRSNCVDLTIRHDGHRPDGVRMSRQAQQSTAAGSSVERGQVATNIRVLHPDQLALGNQPLSSDDKSLEPFIWNIDAVGDDAEAETRAQAKANEAQFKIRAEGELDGTIYGHVLLTHLPVELDGVGAKYGGTYYVDEVTHHFTQTGYRQRFSLIRNATN